MKKVAVIGCGALAHAFASAMQQVLKEEYQIIGFLGRTEAHTLAMAQNCGAKAFAGPEELLSEKPDYVVELAGVPAARQYSEQVLSSGCDLVLVSIGALADQDFREQLEHTARESGSRLYVVSGAVGGFDVLQTIALMGTAYAEIDNKKPPENLAGAPYLDTHPLHPDREELVFSGSVQAAIEGFPKNVNVAVAASLAASAPDMQVKICSVPGLQDNRHQIRVETALASAEITTISRPDPANPRSSTIAAWSVVALLKNLASPIVYF